MPIITERKSAGSRERAAWLRHCNLLAVLTLASASTVFTAATTSAQDREPIAASGHGGFFDANGRQVAVTLAFVGDAQKWYRAHLLTFLDTQKRSAFTAYERRLYAGLNLAEQERLLVQHEAIEWLLANIEPQRLPVAMRSKLRGLAHLTNWKLPVRAELGVVAKREPFRPRPEVAERLKGVRQERTGGVSVLSITVNSGEAYLKECAAAGVPVPPNINVMDPAGLAGWKSQGFIPTEELFIEGTPAELRSYQTKDGMCFALPRYTDASLDTVYLDGVICMGKQSSKVCFWDNQWTVDGDITGFTFTPDEIIPIGVPSAPGGKYQAGGKEIEFGPGNICTDCHAGENPYIIHPKVDLAAAGDPALLWETLSVAPQNLPTMAVNRYDPIVAASWPQNQLSQAGSTVPAECGGCHVKGSKGRFPHLSNEIPQYCSAILGQAITRTMPPGAAGSASTVANTFKNTWCGAPPDADSADSGDPHITTVNGVHYDFQAAGEFVALRNVDSGFELQTRQSPVLTSFTPGADAHTGLGGCVSLNSAVALRAGSRRITYQGGPQERALLRLDGSIVSFSGQIALGGGNFLEKGEKAGEIDVQLADGTRVILIPLFWSSQGYWYIDVQVQDTPAREGVMGPVLPGDWLPRAPSGASFGPKPVALLDRHQVLNRKFADAWRVGPTFSLFDYAPGTSGASYTDRNWPAEPGKSCTSTTVVGPTPTVKEPQPNLATRACGSIADAEIRADCIFDVTVLGDPSLAQGHLRAEELKN